MHSSATWLPFMTCRFDPVPGWENQKKKKIYAWRDFGE